jgi:hypothetical protein
MLIAQPRLDLRPVTRDEARAFVREHHRHHSWPVDFLWLHGLTDDDGWGRWALTG